ncbi:MAG TPA: ABC transporter permease [Bryobacteraceae bacterium]|jgi:predicted permease
MILTRFLRIVRQRLRSLLGKSRVDAELSHELAFHFDQLVRENVAEGMNPQDARRAARRVLGNVGLLEEQCRDQRRTRWFDDARQDAVYAGRMMRKNPALTAIAAMSLAVGIGANTTVLGVADAMLFGNLPYRDSGRLVMIRTFAFQNPATLSNASLPDFFAFKEQTRSFESVGCSLADQKNLGAGEDGAAPERIFGQGFSPGLFETLAVQPLLGRTFTEADYRRGPPAVVVLSHGLWRRYFRADPNILGRHIRLNEASTEIIGVMPPDFRFAEERAEYWVPMNVTPTPLQAGVRYFIVAARLRKGATPESAQAELSNVATQLAADYPETHQGWGARLQPMREALFGWTREALVTLEAAAILVLLIACANVAALLLARGSTRRRELAMRAALGAGRARIARQMITESLLLACIGGALGVAVTWVGLHALPLITPPPNAPRLPEIPLNVRMLLMTGLTSVLTGLIFGVSPALAVVRQDLSVTLKTSPRGKGMRTQYPVRGVLVAGQVAFAFVLVVGASLLLKSAARLAGRELHFDPHGLATFEVRLPTQRFMHSIGSYHDFPYMALDPPPAPKFERILDRLRRVPGTDAVAGISGPPVNGFIVPTLAVTVDGGRASGDTSYFLVTPHFFATMRAEVVRGRDFDTRDTQGAAWVAVVNETAAHRFWPGQDPLGQRFSLDSVPDDRPREVIGVVRDIPTRVRETGAEPVIYASYLQQPSRYRLPWANMLGQMTFVVRAPGNPMALVPAARKAVAEIDSELPLSNIAPMDAYTGVAVRDSFYYALALSAFASVAAFLAAMGAYGVAAYAVAQRTHEIGIRVALGARPVQVFRIVGRQTVLLLGAGLGTGWVAARSLSRLLASQLWQVAPTDPSVFAAAFLVLAVVAGLACAGPLRRGMQVNPVLALRTE